MRSAAEWWLGWLGGWLMPPYGPRLIISTTSFQAPRQFQCPHLLSSWNLGLSRTWLDIPQSWFISSSNENSHQFSSERLSIKIDLYSYRTNTTPPNSKTGHPSLMESMALIRRQNLRWTGCRSNPATFVVSVGGARAGSGEWTNPNSWSPAFYD